MFTRPKSVILDEKHSPATKVEKSGILTKYPEKVTFWHVLATNGFLSKQAFLY